MNKIRLTDTTFIIPFFYDHKERLENLNCILKFLTDNFETNIIISESGEVSRKRDFYSGFEYLHIFEDRNDGIFHRTKVINNGIKEAETKYISVYDTDVIFEPKNILKAVECLTDGATLAYPYSGNFIDVERSYLSDGIIKERESFTMDSYGGAYFANLEDYWKCGLDYEEFISWSPDDIERVTRVRKLGYRVDRVDGVCWHINHPPSPNSGVNNYTTMNLAKWNILKEMDRDEIEAYISKWSWAKR